MRFRDLQSTRRRLAKYTSKEVDHSKFTDAQGYLVGGVDVEMSSNSETQVQEVQGQGSILSEKRRSAKWY